jgi:hypothetical protein
LKSIWVGLPDDVLDIAVAAPGETERLFEVSAPRGKSRGGLPGPGKYKNKRNRSNLAYRTS